MDEDQLDEDGQAVTVYALGDDAREGILAAQHRLLVGFIAARHAHLACWGFQASKKATEEVFARISPPCRCVANSFSGSPGLPSLYRESPRQVQGPGCPWPFCEFPILTCV